MTLPYERLNALLRTRDFLRDLLDPKKTPRVPRRIRLAARSCLKHYPHEFEIEKLAELAPNLLGGK